MTTPNDSLDFYPTPDSLAFDMVFSLREVKIRVHHLPETHP